jgi:hypothetical protein
MHLLRRFSSERELINNPHASVGKRYDAHKFHFISVRNPVDQYLSLYAFGCGGVGTLYNKMRKAGYDHLYNGTWAGFRNWIDLILDPENRRFLVAENREYEASHTLLGVQSFRFLQLALQHPTDALAACKNRDDIRNLHSSKSIVNYTIRHEAFDSDFETLLTTKIPHAISDVNAAIDFIKTAPRINTSDRFDRYEAGGGLGRIRRQRLQDREWLLSELFGY